MDDDAEFARRILARSFRGEWCVAIGYSVPQGISLLNAAAELDLVLVDLNMPGGRPFDGAQPGGGFEVVQYARARFPRARVVVVSGHFNARLVNLTTSLGAYFLFKQDLGNTLGELARSLVLADRRAEQASAVFAEELAARYSLSKREAQIVALSAEGLSNSEIAARLNTSPNTIKSQVRSILDKCGAERMATLREKFMCRCCPRY